MEKNELENNNVQTNRDIEEETRQKVEQGKKSGMAITALVCGIISVCSCGMLFIPEILGIVFACIAMKDKSKKQTMAKAGLVMSILSFVLSFLLLIVLGMGSGESATQKITTEEVTVEPTTEIQSTEKKTEENKVETEFNLSDYRKDITYESLMRTPDKYKDMKIQMTGEVAQVIEGEKQLDLRIYFGETYDCGYLVCKPDVTDVRILENDNITFYGVYQGLYTYKTVSGSEETVPLFNVDSLVINNYDGTSDSPSGDLREGTYVLNNGAITSTADFSYQDGEAFYCRICAVSDDKGYGLVECFLTDNGDGTYTGMIPDEGTIDILVKGSTITVTSHPDAGCEMYFENLDGEYVYQ